MSQTPLDLFLQGKELDTCIKKGISDCEDWLNTYGKFTGSTTLKTFQCYSVVYPSLCPHLAYLLTSVYMYGKKLKVEDVHSFLRTLPYKNTEEMRERVNKALDTLTERERKILQLRCGLITGKVETYDSIGQIMGYSRERIRQIIMKASRKLNHPYRKQILFSTGELDSLELTQEEKATLWKNGYSTIKSSMEDPAAPVDKHKIPVLETNHTEVWKILKYAEQTDFRPLEALELSNRTYNTLKRSGIDYIWQLQKMDEDTLRNIRTMNLKGMEEIKRALLNLSPSILPPEPEDLYTKNECLKENVDFMKNHKNAVLLVDGEYYTIHDLYKLALEKQKELQVKNKSHLTIEELPLDTRTYNALSRYGIEYAYQIMNMSTEELKFIPNLGRISIVKLTRILRELKEPIFPTVLKKSPLIIADAQPGTTEMLKKAGYEVKEYNMDDINSQHGTFHSEKEQLEGE